MTNQATCCYSNKTINSFSSVVTQRRPKPGVDKFLWVKYSIFHIRNKCFLQMSITTLHEKHTHTTILWPSWILSKTTRVRRHQKDKPIGIYWSKRCSGISWAICKSAHWPRHNHKASHLSVFHRLDALPATQQHQSTEKIRHLNSTATANHSGTHKTEFMY